MIKICDSVLVKPLSIIFNNSLKTGTFSYIWKKPNVIFVHKLNHKQLVNNYWSIIAKLKFLYRQSRYLTPAYRRLLCNALTQPHFDYGCASLLPLLKKDLKLKLQKAQTKCLRFCLNLPPRSHIDPLHFRKINWLPVSDQVE